MHEDVPVTNDDAEAAERPSGPETQRRLERKTAYERKLHDTIKAQESDETDEEGRRKRQNVRVDVRIPFEIKLGDSSYPVRSRDLSATGVGFVTRLPIVLETEGIALFDFDSWQLEQSFVCKFVKPLLAGWQVGAQFTNLEDEQRERLVREVFDIQRAQLRTRQ